jgi:hypothetical protein
MLQKIALFLHIIDSDNTLNLADIAFMVVLIKIIAATNVDWPSMVTLMTVALNMMHQRHVNAGDTSALQTSIQNQTETLKVIQEKVSPILDAIKGQSK